MKNKGNYLILNGIDLGISKIELDRSDLRIIDKTGNYCLKIYIMYNWKEINRLKIKERSTIDFNEYCFSENNESALIVPTNCYVEKIKEDVICFYFKFSNLSISTHFMNERNCFNINLDDLECQVFIDYKDVKEGTIVYDYSNN